MAALVEDGTLRGQTLPPKKRGRPSGSKNAKQPPPASKKQKTTDDTSTNGYSKACLVAKITAIANYFPGMRERIEKFDFDGSTAEECELYLEKCKAAISCSGQSTDWLTTIITYTKQAELMLVATAYGAPIGSYRAHCANLDGFVDAMLQDEQIMSDIKLISVDLIGEVSGSPYTRLVKGIIQTLTLVYVQHKTGMRNQPTQEPSSGPPPSYEGL